MWNCIKAVVSQEKIKARMERFGQVESSTASGKGKKSQVAALQVSIINTYEMITLAISLHC